MEALKNPREIGGATSSAGCSSNLTSGTTNAGTRMARYCPLSEKDAILRKIPGSQALGTAASGRTTATTRPTSHGLQCSHIGRDAAELIRGGR